MPTPIVRMFENEEQARAAAAKLHDAGFYDDVTFVVAPPDAEQGGASVDGIGSAMMAGQVLGDKAGFYLDRVRSGRSVVVVAAPAGMGKLAGGVLDGCGPVDVGMTPPAEPDPWGAGAPFSSMLFMPVIMSGRPSPFSRLFGFPLLAHGQSTFGTLGDPHYHASAAAGMPLLTRLATPLSSLLGMGTLFNRAAPLSSMTGMATASRSGAPLSSLFGMPLFLRSAAPLSSLFSLPLLARAR